MRLIRSLCLVRRNIQGLNKNLYVRYSQISGKEDINTDQLLPPVFIGDSDSKQYTQHIHDIVDRISKLTLLEVADLSELLQKRLNIKSPAGMMPMMVQPSMSQLSDAVDEEPVSVKSSFIVKLLKFDAVKKVQLIKEIKLLLPEMNLVQAKKFVESAPSEIKRDVSKTEAEEIKKILEEAGASVEIE